MYNYVMYTTVMRFEIFISRIFSTLHLSETENYRILQIFKEKLICNMRLIIRTRAVYPRA